MFPFYRNAPMSCAIMLLIPFAAVAYLLSVYSGLCVVSYSDLAYGGSSVSALERTLDRYKVTVMRSEIIFAFYCSKMMFPFGWILTIFAFHVEKERWREFFNAKSHSFYERLALVSFCMSVVCLVYMYMGIEITHGSKIILTVFSGGASGLAYGVLFLVSLYFCVIQLVFAIYGWGATAWQVRARTRTSN